MLCSLKMAMAMKPAERLDFSRPPDPVKHSAECLFPRITARMVAVIRQAQQRWVAGGTPAAQAAEARNKPRQHHEEKALATMLSRAPLENPYCTSSRSKRFGKKAAGRMQLRRIIGSDSFRRKEALPSTAPETAGRLRAKSGD